MRSGSNGNWFSSPLPGRASPTPTPKGPEQVSSLSLAQLLPGGKEGKLVAQCA